MVDRRRELIRAYKDTPRAFGVYRIRNTANGRALVGASRDLRARLNRHQAELSLGIHPNKALLNDWKEFRKEAFEFSLPRVSFGLSGLGICTLYAPICWVMPPASPATTSVVRIPSSNEVFPWST